MFKALCASIIYYIYLTIVIFKGATSTSDDEIPPDNMKIPGA